MPKLRFDREAVAGFFVSHVEKFVLGVVLLLFVVFVYTGYSLDGLESGKTPEDLMQISENARNHITEGDTWASISTELQPPTGHEQRAKSAQSATLSTAYAAVKPYIPANKPSGEKRLDPELLPPIELETKVVVGPLAYYMEDNDLDLLEELENTEMIVKKKKKKKRRKGRMTEEEMMASFGGEEEVAMDDSMVSGGGPDIAGEGAEELATAAGREFPGYRPPQGSREVVGKPGVIVAVTALVPYKEQWDKFEQTFASAMHYNPGRDVPKYLTYTAERAEVSDDPNAELKWERVSWTTEYRMRAQTSGWTGLADEIADPRYLSEGLTMPIPPIMMRELEDFALHSKVPRYIEFEPDPLVDEDSLVASAGPGGIAELPESDLPSFDTAVTGDSVFGGEPQPEAGSFGSFGNPMAGGGPAASYSEALGPKTDYLLVRFFDFTAEMGKKYRYRVQLLVEDPNHPQEPRLTPMDRALSDTVLERIAALPEKEGQRYYFRRTEFSEPSDIVTVDVPRTTLAGQINKVRDLKVGDTAHTVPAAEPSAKVMAIVWDAMRSVDVPALVEAYRGTLLDFTKSTDAVHPITLQFKKFENYRIKTNRLLVDFRGGEVLPVIEKKADENAKEETTTKDEDKQEPEELLGASEFIFLDLDGNFFVRNDLEDQESFELYLVPEKEEEITP